MLQPTILDLFNLMSPFFNLPQSRHKIGVFLLEVSHMDLSLTQDPCYTCIAIISLVKDPNSDFINFGRKLKRELLISLRKVEEVIRKVKKNFFIYLKSNFKACKENYSEYFQLIMNSENNTWEVIRQLGENQTSKVVNTRRKRTENQTYQF